MSKNIEFIMQKEKINSVVQKTNAKHLFFSAFLFVKQKFLLRFETSIFYKKKI